MQIHILQNIIRRIEPKRSLRLRQKIVSPTSYTQKYPRFRYFYILSHKTFSCLHPVRFFYLKISRFFALKFFQKCIKICSQRDRLERNQKRDTTINHGQFLEILESGLPFPSIRMFNENPKTAFNYRNDANLCFIHSDIPSSRNPRKRIANLRLILSPPRGPAWERITRARRKRPASSQATSNTT